MKVHYFLLSLLFLACFIQGRQITLRNNKFYDSQNRQITFHGTNVVVKGFPYAPDTGAYNSLNSFGPEDIQNLKQNGFNAIRLGVMWAGVQTANGQYNQTYLDLMVNIVNSAGKEGIYTLVEFHQDLLSQTFCGDGVPPWLVDQLKLDKTFPFPMNDKVIKNQNDQPQCGSQNWSKYYFSYDVGRGFADLYNKNHKLNAKFIKYWQKVAHTFKDNPYVIAYQLINQPWIGNVWRNPTLIIPSMAERQKLQGLYDQLSKVIRQIDPNTPLCFEPVTFDNFVPSGFSHPPGGNRYKNSSILCYHHYQPPALGLKSLDTYVNDAKKLGIGSLLSQTYGSPQTLDRAEYWKQSWMYWCYKDFGNNMKHIKQGFHQKDYIPLDIRLKSNQIGMSQALVRTYLTRVAGQLQQSKYDTATGRFTGTYFATPNGQSILYLNKQRIYKNSYSINVFPQNQVKIVDNGDNQVIIKYLGTQRNKKILVTVDKL